MMGDDLCDLCAMEVIHPEGLFVIFDNDTPKVLHLCRECFKKHRGIYPEDIKSYQISANAIPELNKNFPACYYCGGQSIHKTRSPGVTLNLELLKRSFPKTFHYTCEKCHRLESELWEKRRGENRPKSIDEVLQLIEKIKSELKEILDNPT